MKNSEILQLQCGAGLILQQVCTVLHISREDFSDILAKFLSAGKKTKKGVVGATVLGYFQKLPKKHLVPEDSYKLFRMVIENAIIELCEGKGPCTVDEKAVSDSWEKHGDKILCQLDRIHEKAADAYLKTTVENNRQKIEDLLSD